MIELACCRFVDACINNVNKWRASPNSISSPWAPAAKQVENMSSPLNNSYQDCLETHFS